MATALIQTRMGSTRLPGKVLKEVKGKPLIWYLCDRLKFSKFIKESIIITTGKKSDDPIVKVCDEFKIRYFRGSEDDVLDRYYQAAKEFKIKTVVRITSDCPLIDPEISDTAVKFFKEKKFDFVTTNLPMTFPDGLDTEVFSFEVLENAWENAREQHQREHVTTFIWEQPEKFKVGNIYCKRNLFLTQRWTLDYEEDYLFIKTIFENLYKQGKVFHMNDVLAFLRKHPEIYAINIKHHGESWETRNWDDIVNTVKNIEASSGINPEKLKNVKYLEVE